MVRRSAKPQHYAERHFPVRVRVAAPPPPGFGRQLDSMHAWLDQHAGKDRYYIGTEAGREGQDSVLFYFLDVKMAAHFVDRFACGLTVGRQSPWSTPPQ